MNHLHYDLSLQRGDIVEITLDRQANVRLMDSANYHKYRAGGRYSFYGGKMVSSLAKISTPFSGNWHLAIDLGGRSGRVSASVQTTSF